MKTGNETRNLSKELFSSKEVQKEKYQLHYNFCIKNVTKCSYCEEPVQFAELKTHIEEASGTK